MCLTLKSAKNAENPRFFVTVTIKGASEIGGMRKVDVMKKFPPFEDRIFTELVGHFDDKCYSIAAASDFHV